MALIQSGAGTDLLTVDPTSKAARVTLYDASGSVLTPSAPGRGVFTDRSGTITLGGTAQTLSPINNSRHYIEIQNNSAADLWINFTTAAVLSQPSLKIPIGATYVSDPQWITPELISIIGPNTGQTYTVKES